MAYVISKFSWATLLIWKAIDVTNPIILSYTEWTKNFQVSIDDSGKDCKVKKLWCSQ